MQMNKKAMARANDMKRSIPLYDFKAFGEAIKEAQKKRGKSANKVSPWPVSHKATMQKREHEIRYSII